jgi:hypothetical protein
MRGKISLPIKMQGRSNRASQVGTQTNRANAVESSGGANQLENDQIMKKSPTLVRCLLLCALALFGATTGRAVDSPAHIAAFSKPAAGSLEMLFHGSNGPYLIQCRDSLDANAVWKDVPTAVITEVQPGIYTAFVPSPQYSDLSFYRVQNEGTAGAETDAWTVLLNVSAPANGQYFVAGETPTVTVTILDTMAAGLSRTDFSTLNLYMYGPQDPQLTKTAVKLLNASTDRKASVHHYISLKSSPGVQANGNVLTYQLQPISDEAPGTYTISLYTVRASNPIEQLMKFANVQIGNGIVESPVVTKAQSCAACHEGPASGKVYMHHIDPGFSPTGNWSLDYQPVVSCKSCHNNDGYASYTDVTGAKIPDNIVFRVHGVHMGSDLSSDANTNILTGLFKDYTDVEFPADVRNCTKCHVDDRWKTTPTRLACGSCHDNIWFGPQPGPINMVDHEGGQQINDTMCVACHQADKVPGQLFTSIAESHKIAPPSLDSIDIALTPPANGKNYVAGEKPVVTITIKDDAGRPIDHTKVTDGNFSTASLFVYGPRAEAMPVLTSAAKNVNSKLRASVSSSVAGPWTINGKVFKIAVNGSAPQSITIVGATDNVTPAEFVAAVNPVIQPLNAKATASATGVTLKTTIQGSQARFEIYNGDVTTAMGWKRGPNTVMDPDVTIAAAFTPANDLRALSDSLDYQDPMVTRATANVTYQLDDVSSLVPGTYNVYVYQLPKAGKVTAMTAAAGIGFAQFQVGTATVDKKVATNCKDCHGENIWHLTEGPIHPEPFDTDYCTACHDYGHNAPGDMFKNQGGTSLNGWSGFGAMPISRRVHGVHRGAYLEHPEEIYANATKDTFGHIIFPQDIRNCTKCHSESDAWLKNPSRMACLACHDGDDAKAHGKLMTFMGDPNDPYGPLSYETCTVCHEQGREFSADKLHKITNPYVPPYPR